jgi:hypothetical protein
MRALFNRNVLSRSRARRISKTTDKYLMLGLGASIGTLLLSWKYVAAQDLETELEIQEEAKEIQQFQGKFQYIACLERAHSRGDKEMIKNWQNKELWAKEQVQLIDENGNIGVFFSSYSIFILTSRQCTTTREFLCFHSFGDCERCLCHW